MSKLDDLQRQLEGNGAKGKEVIKEKPVVPRKPAKNGKYYVPNGKGHGDGGNGRPPKASTIVARNFKSWLNTFINEDVWVKVNEYDKKGMPTGKVITIKRPRIANAMSKLYEMGIKGDGDSSAIDLLLNRYLGRPAQPLRGEGEDDAPIQVGIQNLGEFIKKVYGQK